MKYLLADPVNVKEWSGINAIKKSTGPDIYFAYQTFAGPQTKFQDEEPTHKALVIKIKYLIRIV